MRARFYARNPELTLLTSRTPPMRWAGYCIGFRIASERAGSGPQSQRPIRPDPRGNGLFNADGQPKFVPDFIAAWEKVMDLDRFDLA